MTEIDPVSKAIGELQGEIKAGFEGINRKIDSKFAALPCERDNRRILKLEAYQNREMGIIATLGLIVGFIGWLLTPVISWVLGRFK